MKLTKPTLIVALTMFLLSSAANAMLPMMLLMMGGGMMQGMDGHGGAAHGGSSSGQRDHAGVKQENDAGVNAVGGEHRHDSAPGTPGAVDAAGVDRPVAEGVVSGRVKPDESGHERH